MRGKTANKWKEWVQYTVGYKKPNRPLTSYSLKIVRHSPRKLDRDNATASYKAIIDALVSCGLLQDDRYSMMKDFSVEQNYRPSANGPLTEIIIEEIP